MKVFITGICGFLGSHIAIKLASKGFEIIGISRKSNPPRMFENLNIKVYFGNIQEIQDIQKIEHKYKNFDYIIHTASLFDDNIYTLKSNFNATQLILNSAIKMKVKNFIFTSTRGTIGVDENPHDSNEDSVDFKNFKLNDNYIKSKIKSEEIVTKANNEKKIKTFILCPTAIIGPNDFKPTPIGKLVRDLLNGKINFYIDGSINLIDVRDAAEAFYLLMINKKRSHKYGLGGYNIKLSEFFKLLLKNKKSNKIPYSIPDILVIIIAKFLRMFPFLKTINQMYSYEKIMKLKKGYSQFDSKKIQTEIQLNLSSIDKTIADMINE